MANRILYDKPVIGYIEDLGYNYIMGPGKLLSKNQWFKQAGEFNEDGFAIVIDQADRKLKIDLEGNLQLLSEIV